MKNFISLLTRRIDSSTKQEIEPNLIIPREINGNPTILLVDDFLDKKSPETTVEEWQNIIFGRKGGKDCKLSIAFSIQEALERIQTNPPDLIISELFFTNGYPLHYLMIMGDNFEGLRPIGIDLIKEKNKLGVDIKIIFNTTMAYSMTKEDHSIIEEESYLVEKGSRTTFQDLRTNVRLALNLDSSYFDHCSFSPSSGFSSTERIGQINF